VFRRPWSLGGGAASAGRGGANGSNGRVADDPWTCPPAAPANMLGTSTRARRTERTAGRVRHPVPSTGPGANTDD